MSSLHLYNTPSAISEYKYSIKNLNVKLPVFQIKLKDTVLIFSSKTIIEKVSNECTVHFIRNN